MTTAGGSINAGSDRGSDPEDDDRVDSVRRDLMAACEPTLRDDETAIVLRRALQILDAVEQLLSALSPSEIQAAASHVYLGRLDGQAEVLWTVYGRRHQALREVFASQHSAFARLARAVVERHRVSGGDSRSALDRNPQKGKP